MYKSTTVLLYFTCTKMQVNHSQRVSDLRWHLDRVFTQLPPMNILEQITVVLLPDTGETTHEADRTERRSAGTPALRLGQLFTPAISLKRAKLHYYHSFLEVFYTRCNVLCMYVYTKCERHIFGFNQMVLLSYTC